MHPTARILPLALLTFTGCALTGCAKQTPPSPADVYAQPAKNPGVPDRPEKLTFPEASFEVPKAADFRHEVGDVPVYVAPTHEFPLVEITFTFKGGRYLEADGKWGVGDAVEDLLLHGGTETVAASELDERFAFLAADVSVNVGSEQSSASLNCLTDNLDEAFALFVDMVRNPGWDAEKLALHQSTVVDRMKQRNDDAGDIAAREWNRLAWGGEHYLGRVSTASMVQGLTADDLDAFHSTVFQPGNLVISVTGDVEPDAILPVLEKALEGWEASERVADPPAPETTLQPGLYLVDKDIPQGKVRIGMPGITRDDPDAIPLMVMNDVLGGGGFTSRLMTRIRSDEGLAYGARSAFASRVHFPGIFQSAFDSKSPTVARATDIVFEEIARIRTEPVSDKELELAKTSLIETFPRRFETRAAIVGTFVNDELTDRDPEYWATWREKVEAVTADDVMKAAAAHLDPDKLAILVVGDWEPILKGDLEGKATMEPYGEPTHLPTRDPLTQEPLP